MHAYCQEASLQARLAAEARPRAQQPEPVRLAAAAAPPWVPPPTAGPSSVSQIWSDFGASSVPEQLSALWGAESLAAFSAAESQRQASRLPLYTRVGGRAATGSGNGEFCESERGHGVHPWPLGPQLQDLTLH